MTDTSLAVLLPCPFCGVVPTEVRHYGYREFPLPKSELWAVAHICAPGQGGNREEASAAWNTRATADHPNADDWRNRAERAEQSCAEKDAEIAAIEARVTAEIVAMVREGAMSIWNAGPYSNEMHRDEKIDFLESLGKIIEKRGEHRSQP